MITPFGDLPSGLHLRCPDGRMLSLTAEAIETRSRQLLDNPAQVPLSVKAAADFQLCPICPKRGSGETCHAIRPILAVWDDVDAYPSTTPVTALYVHGERTSAPQLVVADTTLQRALQYVSVLSLLYYCEVGREYWPYFYGVHPLMAFEDVVVRVYLNVFWQCKGDRERTRAVVRRFHEAITVTTECQMRRLRVVCRSDALLNALVLTHLAAEFMVDHVEGLIQGRVNQFAKQFFV